MQKICNVNNNKYLEAKELEYYRAVLKSFDKTVLNGKIDFNMPKDIEFSLKKENKSLVYSTNTIKR